MSEQHAVERLKRFTSDRHFRLWDFLVSHSCLLLRSPRSAEASSGANIDLIFVGVNYLALPDHVAGLDVRVGSQASLAGLSSRLARPVSTGCHLYELSSQGKLFQVIAAQLVVAHTTCDIMESSLVLHFSPDEGAERRFREQYLAAYAVVDEPS